MFLDNRCFHVLENVQRFLAKNILNVGITRTYQLTHLITVNAFKFRNYSIGHKRFNKLKFLKVLTKHRKCIRQFVDVLINVLPLRNQTAKACNPSHAKETLLNILLFEKQQFMYCVAAGSQSR